MTCGGCNPDDKSSSSGPNVKNFVAPTLHGRIAALLASAPAWLQVSVPCSQLQQSDMLHASARAVALAAPLVAAGAALPLPVLAMPVRLVRLAG